MDRKISETLTWKAPSHIHQKRSAFWYMTFVVVFVLLLAYAVYTQSIITFLTFFLLMVVVLVISMQPSSEKTNKITKTGIVSGHVVYPYKIIKKFWIVYAPPEVKTLNFETTAYLNSRVVLQIGRQDPVELKLTLGQYLHEDLEREESLTESLARKLKI